MKAVELDFRFHRIDVQRRLYRYSFANTLLISLQRPEATQVAGFHAWRKLGRHVLAGERPARQAAR
jgi:hypothetical protein